MSVPALMMGGYTDAGPSFSVLNGTLYAVWKGPQNDERIFWASTTYASAQGWTTAQWSTPQVLNKPGFTTSAAPCLTDPDGTSAFAMVWRSATDNSLWYATFNGTTWSDAGQVPEAQTAAAPAATYFESALIVAWRGAETDETLYWATWTPPIVRRPAKWSPAAKIPGVGGSSGAPSLAAGASAYHLFWKGPDPADENIYYSTNSQGIWGAQQTIPGVGTSVSPVARCAMLGAVPTDTIWVAWKGVVGDTRLFYSSLAPAGTWSPQQAIALAATNGRPAVATYDDLILVGWGDAAGASIYWGSPLELAVPPPTPPPVVQTLTFTPPDWSTSGGNTIGGRVSLTIRSDGAWNITFDTWNGPGALTYNYQIRAYLIGPGFPVLLFSHSDHIGQNLVNRVDETYTESGYAPIMQLYWPALQGPDVKLQVIADYELSGAIGFVEKIADDILDLGISAVGAVIGAVIAVTSDALAALKVSLGPGTTIGVVAGVLVFAVGAIAGIPLGSALLVGTAAGAALGAVSAALIESRPMVATEIQMAQGVFQGELDCSKVRFTNFNLNSGRAFTAPGIDGYVYCNFADDYQADMSQTNNGSYPVNGEVMIHELTHAWQIQHNSFVPGFVCSGMVIQVAYRFGDNVYRYGPPGSPWAAFNLEQQASIVNEWFAGQGDGPAPGFPAPQASFPGMDVNNPYFQYISQNIRTGQAGFSYSVLGD